MFRVIVQEVKSGVPGAPDSETINERLRLTLDAVDVWAVSNAVIAVAQVRKRVRKAKTKGAA